jgi:nucleotide-binding universal stress UspA family protein
VTSEACGDSARAALLTRAAAFGADLVVVGSHGRSPLGRFFIGSVSQSVVNNASCSVRVCRKSTSESITSAVRLVIGIDGSPEAAAAVQAVAMRKWPAGSEATVVAAIDLRMLTMAVNPGLTPVCHPSFRSAIAAGRTWAREAADRAADELREAGIEATAVVVEGDPKHVLVREAEVRGADCVFVGAQGLGRLERLLIGSVASAVAARATCSVEVVRHGQ